ncbi:putative Serine-peptidase 212 [Daphnia magna]|uniref:Putative Serine-peptidase 212 n=1 Tax=Daphnia magna TaxID=35525 RepID=A0A164ZPT9_9CRUS|nr:putative Serine-peptidase 212 [Daphnia magna]
MVKHFTFVQFYLHNLIICLVLNRSQQQQVECGRSKLPMESGSEAEPGEFPWMVHLLIQQNGDDEWFSCSGTLISDSHVLTAAQCVHKENRLNSISSITLGAHGIRADSNSMQIVDWKIITIPAGLGHYMVNDIAVITLTKPAYFTDHVQPICLPPARFYNYMNESVVLTGWGQHNDSTTNLILYKSDTVLSSFGTEDQCQKETGIGPFSDESIICTHASICHRYVGSGTPMNHYNKELDRWFVLGVAGKVDASTDCQSNKPILFTRVTSQLDFLLKHSDVTPPYVNDTTVKTTEATTTTTTSKPPTFSCAGKLDGYHPDASSSCSKTFYMCSHGRDYTFTCGEGLAYRTDIRVCDWPSNVAGCNPKNFIIINKN